MTDQIKPEWVGRMAAAQWHYEWPDREFCREPNDLQDFYYESARTGLEAVAPLIAAQALRDAAEACTVTVTIRAELGYKIQVVFTEDLMARADAIEHDARCPHRKCPSTAGVCCCPAVES